MLGTLGTNGSARTCARPRTSPDRPTPAPSVLPQCLAYPTWTLDASGPWALSRRAASVVCASKPTRNKETGSGVSARPTSPSSVPAVSQPLQSAPQGHASLQASSKVEEVEEEDELQGDGFLDNDEDVEYDEGGEAEYGEGDEEEEDEEEEGEDDYAASVLEPDDAPREVLTGDTSWGEVVLRATREVLAQPGMQGLELYLFRALPASRKVDIRLDKLDDLYGSPSIDDIEKFQRRLFAALDRELGVEAAGEISFEVSSPGAERLVRLPDELRRFAQLPLKVEYRGADGKETSCVLVLSELDEQAGSSAWRLANVRANAPVKGRALSKKQLSQRVMIPLADITRVRIHVDF